MSEFRKDGRRFEVAAEAGGWSWSVRNLDGKLEAGGVAPSKAAAAARVVSATLAGLEWPEETGMTDYRRAGYGRA